MDTDSLSGLAAISVLIFINALLTMAHAAIVNAHVREEAEDGNRRAIRIMSMAASTQFSAAYQTWTLLLQFAIAAIAALNIVQPILAANPSWPAALLYGLVLGLVALLTLILGSIVPEAVGSTYANLLAFGLLGMLQFLIFLTGPVVLVILQLSRLFSRLFGSDKLVNIITEEEIMTLVDAGHTGGTIEEEEKDMIYSVLQLGETRVSEVMVPRIDVVAIEENQPIENVAALFVESGYSRIPVYAENIDNIKGLLYAKDLLAYWRGDRDEHITIHDLIRPVHFVSEIEYVDQLLKTIQQQKIHLAIVQDEYGGTAGLVTIENIIEEIIGDIQDEYDLNEEAEYVQVSPDEYLVDASIDLDDFNDMLDVDLPTAETDTLAGYIYTYFGRVPIVGESIEVDDLVMNVVSLDGLRIRKVQVLKKQTHEDDEQGQNSKDRDKARQQAISNDS